MRSSSSVAQAWADVGAREAADRDCERDDRRGAGSGHGRVRARRRARTRRGRSSRGARPSPASDHVEPARRRRWAPAPVRAVDRHRGRVQAGREDRGAGVADGCAHEHAARPEEVQHAAREQATGEPGERADARQPGVGRDEVALVVDQQRDERPFDHGVGPPDHEDRERLRIEEERCGCSSPAGARARAPRRAGGGEQTAPPTAEAVEGRPEQRRHDRDGCHREQEVEGEAGPRDVGRDVEEERSGERRPRSRRRPRC